jgi:hypothetical protein
LLAETKDDWFYMAPPGGADANSDWGYSGVESPYYNVGENDLYFAGSGRWHGPYSVIEMLMEKYGLSGEYHDFEPGCDFYHVMKFKDGEKTLDEEYKYKDFTGKDLNIEVYFNKRKHNYSSSGLRKEVHCREKEKEHTLHSTKKSKKE